MVKKNLLHLIVLFGLLANKSVLSTDCFEIDLKSDIIVGSLWQGSNIPQESIKDFFELMEKNKQNEKSVHHAAVNPPIKDFIKDCYEAMEDTAKFRDESKENILNIETFIKNV